MPVFPFRMSAGPPEKMLDYRSRSLIDQRAGCARATAVGGALAMISTNLQGVAEHVVRRAQRQGYVVPREVREELVNGNLPDTLWKDVVALARPSLSYRHGRYYYTTPVSDRVRREQTQQRDIQKVVRQLIRQYK